MCPSKRPEMPQTPLVRVSDQVAVCLPPAPAGSWEPLFQSPTRGWLQRMAGPAGCTHSRSRRRQVLTTRPVLASESWAIAHTCYSILNTRTGCVALDRGHSPLCGSSPP